MVVAQSSREGHGAQFGVPHALKAGAEPSNGEPSRGLGRVYDWSPSLFNLHPLERPCLVPSAKIGTEFPSCGVSVPKGPPQGLPLAHLASPPCLGPGRKGQGCLMPRPPINPQPRSSCSLWAWALCFSGSSSPFPCWGRRERVLWAPVGMARGVRFRLLSDHFRKAMAPDLSLG